MYFLPRIKLLITGVCLLAAAACKSNDDNLVAPQPAATANQQAKDTLIVKIPDETGADSIVNDTVVDFIKYTIPAGAQNCLQSSLQPVSGDSLVFDVYFDSSAFYTTTNPQNQADINKLFGYSDCGSLQHTNSARVGWRFYKNRLELWAYCYATGKREMKLIDQVQVNQVYTCTIVAAEGQYRFYLNGGKEVEMSRGCNSSNNRFRLFPYFGGDEHAPHEINIWIRQRN